MGMGPIPWDKIKDYADTVELDDEMREPFIRIIRSMDMTYMDWQRKEQDNQNNKGQIGNRTKERNK